MFDYNGISLLWYVDFACISKFAYQSRRCIASVLLFFFKYIFSPYFTRTCLIKFNCDLFILIIRWSSMARRSGLNIRILIQKFNIKLGLFLVKSNIVLIPVFSPKNNTKYNFCVIICFEIHILIYRYRSCIAFLLLLRFSLRLTR